MADKKKPVVKRSVSMREDVFETADEMANKYFGGNFSSYITYLICADKHGISRVRDTAVEAEVKEEIKEGVNEYVKTDENDDYIDQFINMGS